MAASDATGKDLVVVGSSVLPSTLGATFKNVTVPVVSWESRLFDDMGFVASGNLGSTSTNQTALNIIDASHQLAAGFPTGNVTVSTGGNKFDYGKPPATAAKIATAVGDSTQVLIFGYDTGATMANGTAAARRVGLWMSYNTPTTMTPDGWTLFDAAINWATNSSGGGGNVAPAVNAGVDQTLASGSVPAKV